MNETADPHCCVWVISVDVERSFFPKLPTPIGAWVRVVTGVKLL